MFVESVLLEPLIFLHTTQIRHYRTAEIDGEAPLIEDHLRRVRALKALQAISSLKGLHKCCDIDTLYIKALNERIYLTGLDERLITLDVHDDITIKTETLVCVKTTLCSVLAILGCHYDITAECLDCIEDALIICSHIKVIKATLYLLIHTLYHRLAAEHGRNNTYELHIIIVLIIN